MTMTINVMSALSTLNRLADHPLSGWMERVSQSQLKAAQERILSSKTDPDGRGWRAWQPSTEYSRTRKGNAGQGLLHDEGDLLASLQASHTPSSVSVSSIGTDYASHLQDGTPHMAKRPFLGWGEVSLAVLEIEAAIELAKIR